LWLDKKLISERVNGINIFMPVKVTFVFRSIDSGISLSQAENSFARRV
jgi:hypothetical protein